MRSRPHFGPRLQVHVGAPPRRLPTPLLPLAFLLVLAQPLIAQSASLPERGRPSGGTDALRTLAQDDPGALRLRIDSLYAEAAEGPLDRADRVLDEADALAKAYADVWDDQYLVRDVRRFRGWSGEERRARVAATRLRTSGNRAFARTGSPTAIHRWRASARIGESIEDTATVAAALGNIGSAFYQDFELDSARAYLTEARRLSRAVGARRTELNAAGVLALVAMDEGDLAAAKSLFSTTLEMRRRIGDARGEASDYNSLGLVAEYEGLPEDARQHYEEALRVATKSNSQEPAGAALTNLANLDAAAGKVPEAVRRYSAALEHYRALGNRMDEAFVLRNLGLAHTRTGAYPKAIAEFERADVIYREAGYTHEVVDLREDLVQARLAFGDLPGAAAELQAAHAVARDSPEDVGLAGRVDLLEGDIALEFNDRRRASRAYSSALGRFEAGKDEWGVAAALQGRGYLLLLRGDYDAATRVLEAAARRQDAFGDPRGASWTRILQARASLESGDADEAGVLLQQARRSLAAAGDRVGVAAALGALGGAGGVLTPSEVEIREALADLPLGAAPPVRGQLHGVLGTMLLRQGRPADAARELQQAIGTFERVAGAVGPEVRRAEYLADKRGYYGALVIAELERGDTVAAFAAAEAGRSRAYLEQREPARARRLVALSTETRRTEQGGLKRLVGRVAAALRSLVRRGGTEARVAVRRDEPDADSADVIPFGSLGAVELAVVPATSPFVAPATLKGVSARLNDDEALLNYVVTDSATILFVVRSDQVMALRVPVARGELHRLVEFARAVLEPAAHGTDQNPWSRPLERLHELLITPADESGALRGVQRLVVVPHSGLHYLPFAALMDPTTGRYLAQRFVVSRVNSARAWAGSKGRQAARPESARLSVLALAPFPGELPGSADEVRGLAEAGDYRTRSITGRDASEALLKEEAGRYDILHLATWGNLDRSSPLFSSVALRARNGDDGLLEVHEAARLKLAAGLVVLSACETALGAGTLSDVPAGDDWVSLVNAFLHAGAEEVLATLWQVEDRSTATWMAWFYEAMARSGDTGEAVAAAQRRAIESPQFAHPYYWAGFALTIGDT